MSERPLRNPTVRISSSLHDADGLALNEDGEVQGWKDLSRSVGSVTLKQEYSEAERESLSNSGIEVRAEQQRRIDALTSLAKMETRLVWIGDHILRIARRIRRPFSPP